jgi:hypothetical protein
MKRLILALLTAGTVVTSANAQEPRSILLYGNVDFSQNKTPAEVTNTMWNASPSVGYQFNRNWTVGLTMSWGQDATKSAAGIRTTQNMYGVGPFARYSHYIGRSETFFWFGQADIWYTGGYTTSEGNPATAKHTGVTMRAFPALGINVGRAVCLNFNVGGISFVNDKQEKADNANNTFGFSFGQQVGFGISKNFNTGHKMHSHHEPGDEVHHRKAEGGDDDDAAPKPKKKERNRDEDE